MERLFPATGQTLLLGLLIFAAALFGILTRPIGFLAAFWPANVLLMGIMIRYPVLISLSSWVAVIVGYLTADFITGSDLLSTLWLTAGNLVGVITGVVLFQQLSESDRRLQRPLSVLYLFAICILTSIAAAAVGGGAGVVYFNKSWGMSFAFWFVTEFVSCILLLPLILTAPSRSDWVKILSRIIKNAQQEPLHLAPLFALLVCSVCSVLIGGPGAIVFSVPALLWCALTYNLFTTALLTFAYCVSMKLAISHGFLASYLPTNSMSDMMSLRLGISLLALGPLTAASINSARTELIRNLDRAVNYDFLTNILARRAFMIRGAEVIRAAAETGTAPAVMMIDIDHFKRINDRYGHAAGDQVLISFTRIANKVLRENGLFGRIGGEEFAVILPNSTPAAAQALAEQLRAQVEAAQIELPTGEKLQICISLGLTWAAEISSATLETLLSTADEALYHSKREGRNQITCVQTAQQ